MRGDLVVVRCWRDEAALMRVWAMDAQRVQVIAPEEFERLEAGESELSPIGFRRSDVFAYDGPLPEGHVDWGTMTKY